MPGASGAPGVRGAGAGHGALCAGAAGHVRALGGRAGARRTPLGVLGVGQQACFPLVKRW